MKKEIARMTHRKAELARVQEAPARKVAAVAARRWRQARLAKEKALTTPRRRGGGRGASRGRRTPSFRARRAAVRRARTPLPSRV